MNPFRNADHLNATIRRVTAFRDSADLKAAIDRGYQPTLRVDNLRGVAADEERADVLNLRAYLRAQGHAVHPEHVPGEGAQ